MGQPGAGVELTEAPPLVQARSQRHNLKTPYEGNAGLRCTKICGPFDFSSDT